MLFDEYRKDHLQPLTDVTLRIQNWLSEFDGEYYIAQRLKRRPQILRKMNRFSVRLTQLQDIGGNRIVVNRNEDVECLRKFIRDKLANESDVELHRETDYRVKGRDDTGYRALHIILKINGKYIELQLRSRAQHHWAECIERTSVIYGFYLKEREGDPLVIDYFKTLSDIFYEIEVNREPAPSVKMDLDQLRERAEAIIKESDRGQMLDSYVNDDVLHTLSEVEKGKVGAISNWILVFDWNTGCFVTWQSISRDPNEAYKTYDSFESMYTEQEGFEVVLVGSSNVSMIRKTHSHYFGIDGYDGVLESLDSSVMGFSSRQRLDAASRRVLHTLHRKNYWGKKTISLDTLKNHYCKAVFGVSEAILPLVRLGFVMRHRNGSFSLNNSRQEDIKSYL